MAQKNYTTLKIGPEGKITASGQVLSEIQVPINENRATHVTGLALVSDRMDMLYVRGRIRISFNGRELFPDGNHAKKLIMGGMNVEPNKRMFTNLGTLKYGTGNMIITYRDVDSAALPFEPYDLEIEVEYETPETT